MKAVLLTGRHLRGRGGLGAVRPRPLWPLASTSILQHQIRRLVRLGVRDLAVCGNGELDILKQELGSDSVGPVRIHWADDPYPSGSAGCLRGVRDLVGQEPFLLLESGTVIPTGIRDMLAAHEQAEPAMTFAVSRSPGRPDSYEPAGLYICGPAVMRELPPKGFCDLKEQLVPRLVKRGHAVRAFRPDPATHRVVDAATYMAAQDAVLRDPAEAMIVPPRTDGSVTARRANLWVSPGAHVHPDARIVGPVAIGPGTLVEADCVLQGPTTIGRNCWIGSGTVIRHSILWDEVAVGRACRVIHSIVADGAQLRREGEFVRSVVIHGRLRGRDVNAIDMSRLGANAGAAASGRRAGRPAGQ